MAIADRAGPCSGQTPAGAASPRITPMAILSAEHRVIEQVLAVLEAIARTAAATRAIPAADAASVLEILRTFADRCHHGKEEGILFPALERAAGGGCGPTAVMREEHQAGRARIAAMDAALAAGDADRFAAAAAAYVEMLRAHIGKEDHCLFPIAARMLGDAELAGLVDEFHRVEHEDLGSGTHERMLAAADRLAASYAIPRATVDPAVRALVGAHCGCAQEVDTADGDVAAADELSALGRRASELLAAAAPLAAQVGHVHGPSHPAMRGLAEAVSGLGEIVAFHLAGGGDPAQRWRHQDTLRGALRRLRRLSGDFTPFAGSCGSVQRLFAALREIEVEATAWLDREERELLVPALLAQPA